MTAALSVTVVHELPGRLRLRLSHPLREADAFAERLCGHEGVEPVCHTPRTGSVLLHYDPQVVPREELLVRAALALSLEYDARAVLIQATAPAQELTASVALSGAALLAAGIGRLLHVDAGRLRRLDQFSAVATGSAVVSHAAQEVRQRGTYHPEVVSVVYLAMGVLRGKLWPAAVLTWFASFGRHLLERQAEVVEVRPGRDGESPDVSARVIPASGWQAWLRAAPAVLRAMAGAGAGEGDLLTKLQEVSKLHDQVLDAMGPWKEGIPLRFPRPGRGN